jgi:hypothetical protein
VLKLYQMVTGAPNDIISVSHKTSYHPSQWDPVISYSGEAMYEIMSRSHVIFDKNAARYKKIFHVLRNCISERKTHIHIYYEPQMAFYELVENEILHYLSLQLIRRRSIYEYCPTFLLKAW